MKYNRILLKLSGEVLAGAAGKGIDNDTVLRICRSVKKVADMGVDVGIVVGGGNFWRGKNGHYKITGNKKHQRILWRKQKLQDTTPKLGNLISLA